MLFIKGKYLSYFALMFENNKLAELEINKRQYMKFMEPYIDIYVANANHCIRMYWTLLIYLLITILKQMTFSH